VMMAAQRVADQHRVRAVGVQFAIGLKDDIVIAQLAAARERDRLSEMLRVRRYQTDAVG